PLHSHLLPTRRSSDLLVWNQDLSGKSSPDERNTLDFARSLRSGLTAIDGEFNLKSDPDGQIARSRMALAYGNEATDKFFGLLGGDRKSTRLNSSHEWI